MIIDRIENAKLYQGFGHGVAEALDFLTKTDLAALPNGKHEVDGQQQVDPYRMNELIQSWHPSAEQLREGSGFKGTVAYCGGTFKGHTHCLRLGGKLNDTLMLLFDTKTEFRLKGDRITIGILDMIHQGGTVYTEPQMIGNFLLGAVDMIREWNAAWLSTVDEAMSNSEKCKALFCTIGKDALLPTTDDVVEADPNKRVAKFVLGTVYREASRTWAPLDGVGTVAGSLDIDPTNHPALLKKLYWFLTNEMMNLDDLRIPIPQDVAARRMMIVDPTVFGLGDGIYLNQGALAGNTVWFDGMERPIVLTRQPSGSVMEHFATQAVSGAREFERFRGTPFIYIGSDVLVGLMAVLGGADQDDPAVVWFGAAIVEYFTTVVAAKALEYAKLDGRSVDDVEALDNKAIATKFEKFAASKAHTKFMGYGHRSTIFSLIEQMCATDTNIGIAVNPGIVFNVLFWYGLLDGVPSMAPVTKNLERIIDAFQKTGERLNWLTVILDKFKKDSSDVGRSARTTIRHIDTLRENGTHAKRAGDDIAHHNAADGRRHDSAHGFFRGLFLEALLLLFGQLFRRAGVLHRLEGRAAVGRAGPADHAHGSGGTGLLDVLALIVEHRADLAPIRTAQEGIARPQRAALHDDGGQRTTADIDLRLDHHAHFQRQQIAHPKIAYRHGHIQFHRKPPDRR